MDIDLRLRAFARWHDRRPGIAGSAVADLPATRVPAMRNAIMRRLYGTLRPGVETVEHRVPTRAGACTARTYRPAAADGPLPLVVHFHGGGWVLGSLDEGDWICSSVALGAQVVVASVDYRLAPEHPSPAAREDAYDATVWLAAHAPDVGARGDRVAVMGDSAGGNLAAVVSLLARDGGDVALRGQVLVYPALDLTDASPSAAATDDVPILPRRELDAAKRHYLGQSVDPTDPLVSPLSAGDLSRLPPALVLTAEHDPLRDEGLAYAERLEASGVPVRATDYVGMVHAFLSFPGLARAAPQAIAEICATLTRWLHH